MLLLSTAHFHRKYTDQSANERIFICYDQTHAAHTNNSNILPPIPSLLLLRALFLVWAKVAVCTSIIGAVKESTTETTVLFGLCLADHH